MPSVAGFKGVVVTVVEEASLGLGLELLILVLELGERSTIWTCGVQLPDFSLVSSSVDGRLLRRDNDGLRSLWSVSWDCDEVVDMDMGVIGVDGGVEKTSFGSS